MIITQLTHHDLDGYGAATVVGAYADVSRVVHVSRYADVGPVVETELARLRRADTPEMLVMTDLGLEPVAVTFIKAFAAMNAKRGGERAHRLLVLDHHASSIDQLAAQGLLPVAAADRPRLKLFSLDDPAIVVMVDETRCATRLAYDHRDLYAGTQPDAEVEAGLAVLVEAIDAVDLWRKEDTMFRQALVLDEVFWDNVSGFIPPAHPWHDRFVGRLLLGMAAQLGKGAAPAAIEREVGAIRARIIDDLLSDEPGDDRDLTTRMRIAPLLRPLAGPVPPPRRRRQAFVRPRRRHVPARVRRHHGERRREPRHQRAALGVDVVPLDQRDGACGGPAVSGRWSQGRGRRAADQRRGLVAGRCRGAGRADPRSAEARRVQEPLRSPAGLQGVADSPSTTASIAGRPGRPRG